MSLVGGVVVQTARVSIWPALGHPDQPQHLVASPVCTGPCVHDRHQVVLHDHVQCRGGRAGCCCAHVGLCPALLDCVTHTGLHWRMLGS